MLRDTDDSVVQVLVLGSMFLLLITLPWVMITLYGDDEPRIDEQYWLERGYDPLDASSTGVRSQEHVVEVWDE